MASAQVELPPTFKGVVYDNPGNVACKVDDLSMVEPGPGEVLVRLTHSGVCHSDLSVMLNGWKLLPFPTQKGQVGGHEGVGNVAKLGAGAEANCKIGDRVGIKWVARACGSCLPCLKNLDGMCLNGKISGYYTPGTFQQYAVAPANYVTPIPESLDSAAAAPMLCGGVTTYSALKKSGAGPGDWVAVMGAGGGLGHIAVQLAGKGMGMRVIGIDHSSKKDLVLGLGAEHFVGIDTESDVPATVKQLADGHGAQAVLVLAASNQAYAQSLSLLRFGGKLMVVGVPDGELIPIASASPNAMVGKELGIQAVAVGDRLDAIHVLEMAARGVVKTHYRLEKMDNLQSVFKDMEEGKLMGRVVLDLS